ncbi:hypothetical protein D3C78_1356120 [compost metagenome]
MPRASATCRCGGRRWSCTNTPRSISLVTACTRILYLDSPMRAASRAAFQLCIMMFASLAGARVTASPVQVLRAIVLVQCHRRFSFCMLGPRSNSRCLAASNKRPTCFRCFAPLPPNTEPSTTVFITNRSFIDEPAFQRSTPLTAPADGLCHLRCAHQRPGRQPGRNQGNQPHPHRLRQRNPVCLH